jgi:RNA polymerase sigma factor (sigma-70 family)
VAEHDSFVALMDRLRSSDDPAAQQAAQEVFERYARQLVALARSHFDRRFGHKVDPEDVVQSAYKSFFIRQRDGRVKVGNWQSLWSLLSLITLRKCADRIEFLRARRRDVRRESPAGEGQVELWQAAVDREPSPQEAAMLVETVEELFRSLDDDERPILELSLQGYSVTEISQKLGRAERSVRRLRERTRKRLERMQEAGP